MANQIDKVTRKQLLGLRFKMLMLQYFQKLVDFAPLNRENGRMQGEFANEMENLMSEALCGEDEEVDIEAELERIEKTGFEGIFSELNH